MVSSALISHRGVWEAGRRNWLWKREALDGLRSELERLRPWVGSMSCWALCTMLVRLENMAAVSGAAWRCSALLRLGLTGTRAASFCNSMTRVGEERDGKTERVGVG